MLPWQTAQPDVLKIINQQWQMHGQVKLCSLQAVLCKQFSNGQPHLEMSYDPHFMPKERKLLLNTWKCKTGSAGTSEGLRLAHLLQQLAPIL